jgi:hypothetical protein
VTGEENFVLSVKNQVHDSFVVVLPFESRNDGILVDIKNVDAISTCTGDEETICRDGERTTGVERLNRRNATVACSFQCIGHHFPSRGFLLSWDPFIFQKKWQYPLL